MACRRLLIFPRGNDTARQPDQIAVYLDFPEASYTPPNMSPKAQFELIVENQLHPDKTLSRGQTRRESHSAVSSAHLHCSIKSVDIWLCRFFIWRTYGDVILACNQLCWLEMLSYGPLSEIVVGRWDSTVLETSLNLDIYHLEAI